MKYKLQYNPKGLHDQDIMNKVMSLGVIDSSLINALELVDRNKFIGDFYVDFTGREILVNDLCHAVPDISNVALLLNAANVSFNQKILIIGDNSGYMAEVASHVVKEVHCIIEGNLEELKNKDILDNINGVDFFGGNIATGHLDIPKNSLYNSVIICGAINILPSYIKHLLLENGNLIYIEDTGDFQYIKRVFNDKGVVKEEYVIHTNIYNLESLCVRPKEIFYF